MTLPAIGEIITAKYSGTCTRSGKPFPAGTQIARDEFGYYKVGTPDPGGEIALSGGSGSGFSGWTVGQVVWEQNQAVVITRTGRTYYRDDGWSFGVGDEQGYVYYAQARPATPEEAAPLLSAREVARLQREQAADLKAGLQSLFGGHLADINTPDGILQVDGRRLDIGQGFTAYGTGERLLIDMDGQHVWRLINNGMDGDNWSRNNVNGCVGIRFPLTDERRVFLTRHWPEWATPLATQDDDALETL